MQINLIQCSPALHSTVAVHCAIRCPIVSVFKSIHLTVLMTSMTTHRSIPLPVNPPPQRLPAIHRTQSTPHPFTMTIHRPSQHILQKMSFPNISPLRNLPQCSTEDMEGAQIEAMVTIFGGWTEVDEEIEEVDTCGSGDGVTTG